MAHASVMQIVSTSCVERNLDEVARLLLTASQDGVSLVVLPENFACMGTADDTFRIAETYGLGVIQDKISALAKRFGLWIVAGTIPTKTSGSKVKATCIVFDDKGKAVTRYDKIHLFDVQVSDGESHQESLSFERGDELAVIDTPIGRLGLTICYDLRFPALYQQLMFQGAQVISVPSAFTQTTGLAHWDILLRARAIENLTYVLAANQGGHHENGRHTYGHSMIVEPWGRVLAEKASGTGLATADIDLIRLEQLRKQFPCIAHHVL